MKKVLLKIRVWGDLCKHTNIGCTHIRGGESTLRWKAACGIGSGTKSVCLLVGR